MSAYRRNIRRYYIFEALVNAMFWMPVWVVYLQSHGISLAEIGLADAWTLIIMTAAEVPTGIAADRWGRRAVLVIGASFVSVGAVLFVIGAQVFGGFPMILVAFVPWMLGASLLSGADEALLYDSMQADGAEEQFSRVNARALTTGKASQAFSSIAGGIIAGLIAGYAPFLASALAAAIGAIVAAYLREAPREHEDSNEAQAPARANLRQQLAAARKAITVQPIIRYLVFYRAIINAVPFVLVFLLLQPYAKAAGVPLEWFGVVFMTLRLAGMGGTFIGGKLKGSAAWWWLLAGLAIMLLSGVPSAITVSWLGIAGIAVLSALASFQVPYLSALFNRNVTSDVRATALSGRAMVSTLVLLVFDPLAGVLASRWGLEEAIAVLLGVLALGTLPLWLLRAHLDVKLSASQASRVGKSAAT
jgi:MFS family permease